MTLRTCATCKWMREPGEFAKCVAPRNEVRNHYGWPPSPATRHAMGFEIGTSARYRWQYCISQREDGVFAALMFRTCGRAGRWWEPVS